MGTDHGNLVYLRKNVCIVRTQAGFREALRQFSDDLPLYRRGYPKSYPTLVFLSLVYTGNITLVATCIPLRDLEAALLVESARKQSESIKPKETNMEDKSDSFVCQENGTPSNKDVLIPGTVENWENRTLGADEAFVKRADPSEEIKVDQSLGLVSVNLRMGKSDVEALEALAKEKGLILQAFIRSILSKEINKA